MGLYTTHDCWSGPFSSFMTWRIHLHACIMRDRFAKDPKTYERFRNPGITYESYVDALECGIYTDQSNPLNVLMSHSDCDGELSAEVCGPLADALQDLVDRHMPRRAMHDTARPATERFIQGLRRAHAANEAVVFE